jgi:hypothetical protein
MRLIAGLACLFALAGAPWAFAAEPIQLSIHNGRVSLDAKDVTVGQILAEWARVGHTRIVNAERVPGGRVTLQFTNVPEQEALDVLLRTAAGYIAAARTVASAEGSKFDRILILPTSATAPSGAAAAAFPPSPIYPQPSPAARPNAPPTFLPPGVQRAIGPDGQPVPDDQEGAPAYVPPPPGYSAPAPAPTPGAARPAQPSTRPTAPTGVPVPGMIVPAPKPAPSGPPEVQPTVVQPQR